MKTYTLAAPGAVANIGRAGQTLHLVNDPFLAYLTLSPTQIGPYPLAVAYLLVGFDHVPSLASADAIIPPASEALIAVPSSVQTVVVMWPTETQATFGGLVGATLPVQAEWLVNEHETTIRPLKSSLGVQTVVPTAGTQPLQSGMDLGLNLWHPDIQQVVLDQQWAISQNPSTRPHLAPSKFLTFHFTLVASTLQALAGVALPLVPVTGTLPWAVLLRAWVSSSVATLFVLGDHNLTVGSPGANEFWRGLIPAAGPPVEIDFAEGVELALLHPNSWQCYVGVGGTVELTFALG